MLVSMTLSRKLAPVRTSDNASITRLNTWPESLNAPQLCLGVFSWADCVPLCLFYLLFMMLPGQNHSIWLNVFEKDRHTQLSEGHHSELINLITSAHLCLNLHVKLVRCVLCCIISKRYISWYITGWKTVTTAGFDYSYISVHKCPNSSCIMNN